MDPPVSCRRTHFARRGEELWQTDEIVGGYGEDEGGADLVEAAHFHLREAGDHAVLPQPKPSSMRLRSRWLIA